MILVPGHEMSIPFNMKLPVVQLELRHRRPGVSVASFQEYHVKEQESLDGRALCDHEAMRAHFCYPLHRSQEVRPYKLLLQMSYEAAEVDNMHGISWPKL